MRTAGDCSFVNTTDGGTRGVVDYRDKAELDKAIEALNGSTFRHEKIRCFAEVGAEGGGEG